MATTLNKLPTIATLRFTQQRKIYRNPPNIFRYLGVRSSLFFLLAKYINLFLSECSFLSAYQAQKILGHFKRFPFGGFYNKKGQA
jgi:hypothetical protein